MNFIHKISQNRTNATEQKSQTLEEVWHIFWTIIVWQSPITMIYCILNPPGYENRHWTRSSIFVNKDLSKKSKKNLHFTHTYIAFLEQTELANACFIAVVKILPNLYIPAILAISTLFKSAYVFVQDCLKIPYAQDTQHTWLSGWPLIKTHWFINANAPKYRL